MAMLSTPSARVSVGPPLSASWLKVQLLWGDARLVACLVEAAGVAGGFDVVAIRNDGCRCSNAAAAVNDRASQAGLDLKRSGRAHLDDPSGAPIWNTS